MTEFSSILRSLDDLKGFGPAVKRLKELSTNLDVDFDPISLSGFTESFWVALDHLTRLRLTAFDRADVVSTNLSTISHNGFTDKLRVVFKGGGEYEYADVPRSVYESLLNAESKGKFFNANVKGSFKHTKLVG